MTVVRLRNVESNKTIHSNSKLFKAGTKGDPTLIIHTMKSAVICIVPAVEAGADVCGPMAPQLQEKSAPPGAGVRGAGKQA